MSGRFSLMQRLNRLLAEATLSTSCARVATYWSPSGSEGAGGSAGTTFANSKLAMAVSIDLVIKIPLFYTDLKLVFPFSLFQPRNKTERDAQYSTLQTGRSSR